MLLVGNGPSILDNQWGHIIDAWDGEVVRFNRFVLEPEECTGTKAEWWFTSAHKTSWRHNPEKHPDLIWVPALSTMGKSKRYRSKESSGVSAIRFFIDRGDSVVLHGFDHFDLGRRMHYWDNEPMKYTHRHDKQRVEDMIAKGKDIQYLKDIV